MLRALCVVAVGACLLQYATALRLSFPKYLQCDPRWGSDQMGTDGPGERSTICGEGCAMTSLSMALAGLGITIEGQPVTPKLLNAFLIDHNGYLCMGGDCNNLVLNCVVNITDRLQFVSEAPKPALHIMQQALAAQTAVYLAHVRNNHHFVLLTGWDYDANAFTVLDPNYDTTHYAYDDVSDVIQYAVRGELDVLGAPHVPNAYPVFKQCDSQWGSDVMMTTTVCKVGCLMSSTSMALAGKGIAVGGKSSNPGVFNAWLRNNGGYTSTNNLIEEAVPKINPARIAWPADAMHVHNDLPLSTIQSYLTQGRPVIANVMAGRHFVLVVGWDTNTPDTLIVNDPGFDRTTYSYSADVVGWRLFTMS